MGIQNRRAVEMKVFAVFIMAIILTAGCATREKREVKVIVVDSADTPIQNASVRILSEIDAAENFQGTTDENGGAMFGLNGGTYKFTVTKEGYFTSAPYLEIKSEGPVTITLFESDTRENFVKNTKIGEISIFDWFVYDGNGKVSIITDAETGERAFKFLGSDDAAYIIGDAENGMLNMKGNPWENRIAKKIAWKMKFEGKYRIYVSVSTASGHRILAYSFEGHEKVEYIPITLNGLNDGKWHSVQRDLEQDIKGAEPENALIAVNGFMARGNGLVTEIELS